MDAERSIDEIEWLERIFAVPDRRPLSPNDLSAANRTTGCKRIAHGFGFGSGTGFVAARERVLPIAAQGLLLSRCTLEWQAAISRSPVSLAVA
jgi:hypothetical protein